MDRGRRESGRRYHEAEAERNKSELKNPLAASDSEPRKSRGTELTKTPLSELSLRDYNARSFWRSAILFSTTFILLNLCVIQIRPKLEAQRRGNLLESELRFQRDDSVEQRPGESFREYWQRSSSSQTDRIVYVVGMSQMYAINDRKPQDRIIADHLNEWLRSHAAKAVSLAAPNLSNEEALFFLLAGLSDPGHRPSIFLFGVCFDKFRNLDLRPEFEAFLASNPALRRRWRAEAADAVDLPRAAEKMRQTEGQIANAEADVAPETLRTRGFEERLRDVLSKVVPVIAARRLLNAEIQVRLFLLRNWLLGIGPTSKRPVIPARQELNRQFLELLVEIAKRERVIPVLYVVPLNPQAESPYIPSEYQEFKAWISDLAVREQIPFADLEAAVPREDWGEVDGGPDFKHFRGEGHRITAAALIKSFGAVLGSSDPRAK